MRITIKKALWKLKKVDKKEYWSNESLKSWKRNLSLSVKFNILPVKRSWTRRNLEVFETNNEEYYVWNENLNIKEGTKFENWL